MDILRGVVEDAQLQEVLLQGSYISQEELDAALKAAAEQKVSLGDVLVSQGTLTKNLLGQVVAEALGVKYADSDSLPTTREQAQKLLEATAKQYRALFVSDDKEGVIIASDLPMAKGIVADVKKLLGKKAVNVYYTLPEFVDTALRLYEKSLDTQFKELLGDSIASIPDIVTTVLDHAVDAKASDVHFEPRVKGVTIRFRIDGVLLVVGEIPKPFYEKVLNRIKVLAQLPIDEHMRAQDGSLRHTRPEGVVNVRISIAPTIEGEKIVMRLLSSYSGFTIEGLGLSAPDRVVLEGAARKPFGMILTTGPTGSGKTTTLYAFLNTRNSSEVNITTIEDPVEYKIEGLNQMQTNHATDLTFARGLRSIVRQDPDVVLVGEIRDKETAEIAINAALTGHLLFSTFHSNDASTTIPRLLDMGIEPFLLSSTLELIVAQRLVRKICENCKSTYVLTNAEARKLLPNAEQYFKGKKQITLYKGTGCQVCHDTGYRGRLGVFELIRNTPEMQDLIVTRPKRTDIWKLAKQQGSRALFDDGFEKVTEGVTTLEELLRVAEPDTPVS